MVALNSPHQIIMSDSRFHELLQCSANEMIGRSLHFCMGPLTDFAKIDAAIQNSCQGISATIHVVLYNRHGETRNTVISCSPFLGHAEEQIGCIMDIENSAAITIPKAISESSYAKALISAQQPCMVQLINDAFTSVFGFTSAQMVGRSLRNIQGPRADVGHFDAMTKWASTGRASSGKLWLSSSACFEFHATISILPIVDTQSDCISNLMVLFDCPDASSEGGIEPSGSGGGAILQPNFAALSAQQLWQTDEALAAAMEHRSPSSCSLVSSHAIPESETHSTGYYLEAPGSRVGDCRLVRYAADISPADRAPALCPPTRSPSESLSTCCWPNLPGPRSPPRCATIRRRLVLACDADDDSGGGPRPASITLELLESMADLTIVAAAQRIRVSTTSLKKACRKLGVERWPYRSDRPPPAAAMCRAKATAYLRRLHRKYGGAEPRLLTQGRSPGPASEASPSSVSSDGPEPEDGRGGASGDSEQEAGCADGCWQQSEEEGRGGEGGRGCWGSVGSASPSDLALEVISTG